MAEKEIIVTIRNELVDNVGAKTPMATSPDGVQNQLKPSGESSVSKIVAANAVKQAASFALSNYGNLTGDYQTQSNIQGGIELIGLGVMATKGPIGLAVAVGSLALKVANQQIDLAKKRQETEYLRARTGMSAYNGGR